MGKNIVENNVIEIHNIEDLRKLFINADVIAVNALSNVFTQIEADLFLGVRYEPLLINDFMNTYFDDLVNICVKMAAYLNLRIHIQCTEGSYDTKFGFTILPILKNGESKYMLDVISFYEYPDCPLDVKILADFKARWSAISNGCIKDYKSILIELRKLTGLSQADFALKYGITPGTYAHWEQGNRVPPSYVVNMLYKLVTMETVNKNRNTTVVDVLYKLSTEYGNIALCQISIDYYANGKCVESSSSSMSLHDFLMTHGNINVSDYEFKKVGVGASITVCVGDVQGSAKLSESDINSVIALCECREVGHFNISTLDN